MTDQLIRRRHSWLIKIGLIAAWPFLAALTVTMALAAFIPAWFLLPFGRFYHKQGGGITMKFPWSDASTPSSDNH